MKLILDIKELLEVKTIIRTIAEETNDDNIKNDFKNIIENSKGLITYKREGLKVEVSLDSKYCYDILKTYNKYLSILIPSCKALLMNYYALAEETQDITNKYLGIEDLK